MFKILHLQAKESLFHFQNHHMETTAIPHGYVKIAVVPIIQTVLFAKNADTKRIKAAPYKDSHTDLCGINLSKSISATEKNLTESRCINI